MIFASQYKTKLVSCMNCNFDMLFIDGDNEIVLQDFQSNNKVTLGKYNTTNRCIEIFEDIKKSIQFDKNNITNDSSVPNYLNGIFDMPKD